MTIAIPDVVRRKAEVAGATTWLADIDALIEQTADRWDLEVGAVLDGATEAVVLAATIRSTDQPVVVKACIPRFGDHASREIATLRHASGRGCVHLVHADQETGVFVVERLGPSLDQLDLPIGVRHRVMCDAAAAMWAPLAPDERDPYLTGAVKGRWLAEFIADTWERLDRPCGESAVSHAVECAERRVAAHREERSVLVHGDVHQWNTLRTLDGSGYKLIDPDGLFAEPEYDLGIIMREDPIELRADPRERSRRLAALTGCDEVAIWEWGVVERLSTGLLCVEIGVEPVGRDMLRTAELVVHVE